MCTPTLREIANQQERMNYEESLKDYRDMYSVMKSQLDKGRAKGKAEGLAQGKAEGKTEANVENTRKMKADGMPNEQIAKYTKLSIEEIKDL